MEQTEDVPNNEAVSSSASAQRVLFAIGTSDALGASFLDKAPPTEETEEEGVGTEEGMEAEEGGEAEEAEAEAEEEAEDDEEGNALEEEYELTLFSSASLSRVPVHGNCASG
jgi:hypothetical protein